MIKKIAILLLCFSSSSFASDKKVTELYKKMITSDNWRMIQLSDDKIYMVNIHNYPNCHNMLDSEKPSYAWNINPDKYFPEIKNSKSDIPENMIKKLNFVLLSEINPDNDKLSTKDFISQQKISKTPYCEAIHFSFI